jgi:hypothetical protein
MRVLSILSATALLAFLAAGELGCPSGTKRCNSWKQEGICIPADQQCCADTMRQGVFWGCPTNQTCGTSAHHCVPSFPARRYCPTAPCSMNKASNPACRVELLNKSCYEVNFTTNYGGENHVYSGKWACGINGDKLQPTFEAYTRGNCNGGWNGNYYLGPLFFNLDGCHADLIGQGGSSVFLTC